MENICIRNAEPSDYLPIISVINAWWGGRNMADMLPKRTSILLVCILNIGRKV